MSILYKVELKLWKFKFSWN